MRGLPSLHPALLAFVTLLHSGLVEAADEAPQLDVQRHGGAETCPDSADISARVSSLLGSERPTSLTTYHVSFTHDVKGFEATISGGGSAASRVIATHGSTCAPLAQATALTLVLLIEGEGEEPESEPTPRLEISRHTKPKAGENPTTLPPIAILKGRLPHETSETSPNVALALGGGAAFGVLRSVAGHVAANVNIDYRQLRVGLGAAWLPQSDLALEPGRITVTLLASNLALCWIALRAKWLQLNACTGFVAGATWASPRGFTTNERRRRRWLGVPLGVSFGKIAGEWGWEFSANALISLQRDEFTVEGLGAAYRPPSIGGTATLQIVLPIFSGQ